MRRLTIVAAALLGIAAAATFVLVSTDGGTGEAGGAGRGGAKATGTATVARRTLAERVTVEGTIGYAGESTVPARLSGTVTALPSVGEVVRRGEELYGIDGEAAFLMYGKVPAYRDLAEGVDDGPDVEELERNLEALGYDPGTVDDEFTSATALAIEAWQEGLGLEGTGEVELGRVTFLPGPQRITKLEVTLGEALGAGSGGGGAQLADYEVPAIGEGTEVPGKEEPEAEAEEEPAHEPKHEEEPREEEPQHDRTPTAEPEAERKPEAAKERAAEQEPEPEEEAEAPSTPILRAGSTRRIVSVELEANQQSLAHRGQKVQVVLPGGAQVKGEVRSLAAIESSGEEGPGEESEGGVEATIAVTGKHRIPALDGAAVSVLFTQRVRKHVLAVPLTSLVAIGGERFAVYVRGAHGRRQVVVSPGLAADGYVEVQGDGLEAGMKVETGE